MNVPSSARTAALLLACALALLWPRAARARKPLRVAVVVGSNLGSKARQKLRYAEHDARKVADVLRELGGFARRDVRLLLGRPLREVVAALRWAERRVRRAQARDPSRGAMLVFYYSGHADGSVLEIGAGRLGYSALRYYLERSRARVRLALIDSCRSGRLVASKGGVRGPSFSIDIADRLASQGFAIVTSSAGNELSHESRRLRGSFFTHYLVSGLRGAADSGARDGRITLSEAYAYAYARTLARTSATFGAIQHPMYELNLSGRGDVVLTTTRGRAHVRIKSAQRVRAVVVEQLGGSVVAETLVGPKEARLSLAPGRGYTVYLIDEQRVREARVVLRSRGAVVTVDAATLDARAPERTARKGRRDAPDEPRAATAPRAPVEAARRVVVAQRSSAASSDRVSREVDVLVARAAPRRGRLRHRVTASALFRAQPVGDGSVVMGAALTYRLQHRPRAPWRPLLVRMTYTQSVLGAGEYFDLGLSAGSGLAVTLDRGWFRISGRFEAYVGYEQMMQPDHGSNSAAFNTIGLLGLQLELGKLLLALDCAGGLRVFSVNEQTVASPDLQIGIGVGWRI
ncbi:MAG: caspase family protein [Myxococcales bacterium]|nr:caspase family protein [Myxococcales bacterium]